MSQKYVGSFQFLPEVCRMEEKDLKGSWVFNLLPLGIVLWGFLVFTDRFQNNDLYFGSVEVISVCSPFFFFTNFSLCRVFSFHLASTMSSTVRNTLCVHCPKAKIPYYIWVSKQEMLLTCSVSFLFLMSQISHTPRATQNILVYRYIKRHAFLLSWTTLHYLVVRVYLRLLPLWLRPEESHLSTVQLLILAHELVLPCYSTATNQGGESQCIFSNCCFCYFTGWLNTWRNVLTTHSLIPEWPDWQLIENNNVNPTQRAWPIFSFQFCIANFAQMVVHHQDSNLWLFLVVPLRSPVRKEQGLISR